MLYKKSSIFTFLFAILLIACNGNKTPDKSNVSANSGYEIEYARGFTVVKTKEYTEVTVRNPWDTVKVLQKYILVDKDKQVPDNLPEGTLVRTPLENVVAYSTIHCANLDELKSVGIIKGVCEPEYISVPHIKKGITDKSIIDLGVADSPDVEKLIMLNPEAIFAAPISGRTFGKIEKTNIPIIQTPDYMEGTALGIAEWLRFYSLFVGKEALADSIYNETKTNYNQIRNKVATVSKRPTVFFDTMIGNVWYVAGDNSFIVNMVRDAGANYVWDNIKKTGSQPMSFEAVLDKAETADIWLIKYNAPKDMTYRGLEKENIKYSYFNAFKNKGIYECNMSKNRYYEDLTIYPDRILRDFAIIFHPDLFKEEKPKYYKDMHE